MIFFKNRRCKNKLKEILKTLKTYKNMNEDILSVKELSEVNEIINEITHTIKYKKSYKEMTECLSNIKVFSNKFSKKIQQSSISEHVEMIVVAIAIAMAVRTYFLQPFKIPTGSMSPTLYGIHAEKKDKESLIDKMPIKYIRWFIDGHRFVSVKAKKTGVLEYVGNGGIKHPSMSIYQIGSDTYLIPSDQKDNLNFKEDEIVPAGAVIWSGYIIHGDHIFVDKVTWNLRRPKLGEVMVFKTDLIPALPKGLHYIKRMCGTPGDTIEIIHPKLLVNGNVPDNKGIQKVVNKINGRAGYFGIYPDLYKYPKIKLKQDQYMALGDNTQNSYDSRYWGPVPRDALVGPAGFIYWPLSRIRIIK